jgi:hypothetical protein
MNKDDKQPETGILAQENIARVKAYLNDADIRFHDLAEDALELYMQGQNLTMHLVIYVHNNHLILRIPGFIRNVEMRRADIMQFLMQVMNDILDIRFEIGKEGNTLSACCQHILEDTLISRRQFDLAMMLLIHIVDDTYPHLMKLLYQSDFAPSQEAAVNEELFAKQPVDIDDASDDENDENEDFTPVNKTDNKRKIN